MNVKQCYLVDKEVAGEVESIATEHEHVLDVVHDVIVRPTGFEPGDSLANNANDGHHDEHQLDPDRPSPASSLRTWSMKILPMDVSGRVAAVDDAGLEVRRTVRSHYSRQNCPGGAAHIMEGLLVIDFLPSGRSITAELLKKLHGAIRRIDG